MQNHEAKTAAELLAEWRIAGRDTVAARAAANVAAMSLEAATAAEAAANEVEAAAKSALDSVEKARAAVARAKLAATQAAEAARLILAGAEGDKVRANLDVEVAEEAEGQARDAFHEAERRVRDARAAIIVPRHSQPGTRPLSSDGGRFHASRDTLTPSR